jgi:hypothetical protein
MSQVQLQHQWEFKSRKEKECAPGACEPTWGTLFFILSGVFSPGIAEAEASPSFLPLFFLLFADDECAIRVL